MDAWSNSAFVQRHWRSELRKCRCKCEDRGHRTANVAHAEAHPLGESELLIHAVTQAGVLPGEMALDVEV